MLRRDFLVGSLVTVYVAACGSEPTGTVTPSGKPPGGGADGGSGDMDALMRPVTPTSDPAMSDAWFPQGLCSGDPKPDQVILWCRIEPKAAGRAETDDLDLEFIVATDEALTNIVARGTAPAKADADHTVRVVPQGLLPATRYYYRFETAGTTTRVARTKTAPAVDADVQVNIAFCACQDMIGRHWHSWRALLEEKADYDFILYLGDYIYETVNDARFQTSAGGADRVITLESPLDTSPAQDKSRLAAGTLPDYRTIYKKYRSDPLLREVHRLYPFVTVWDDHEFSDDCWQDHSTSFADKPPAGSGIPVDEKNTPRRKAANRAFYEYQPADIFYAQDAQFPNDIKIYRKLRFGKHVDLVLTDQRMYRDETIIPEGPSNLSIGKPSANSEFGSRYFVRKSTFDTMEAQARPSLLGAPQKAWLVDAIKTSDATWKVWGNEVQMWEMALKLSEFPGIIADLLPYTVYVNCDQWDGYRSERRQILGGFARDGVDNLLVLTGDIHCFFASDLHVDFASPSAKPIGAEYVTAGISSATLQSIVDKTVPPGSTFRSIANAWASNADLALKRTNPHLVYANTNGYGFATVRIDGAEARVTFNEVSDPLDPMYRGILRRRNFVTKVGTNKVVQL
jgi:alkaline phosphatase D